MNCSRTGINLIKNFEGLRLVAYQCEADVWTIGYGHTAGVYQGMTCTQAQAEQWLLEDVAWAEDAVRHYDGQYHWNQNEFDALTSFAFNLGSGSISQLTANGTRDRATIADKMLLYVNAGGAPSDGLKRRRAAERALFLEGTSVPDPGPGPDPGPDPPVNPDPPVYYPPYNGEICTLHGILQSQGAFETFGCGCARCKNYAHCWKKVILLAKLNGIDDYTGTYEQNIKLMELARSGKLRRR